MALSDKARSIIVFAAYHQLASGESVRDVVLKDGAGHAADAGGVSELEDGGFLKADGDRGRLTETGVALLDRTLSALRGVE